MCKRCEKFGVNERCKRLVRLPIPSSAGANTMDSSGKRLFLFETDPARAYPPRSQNSRSTLAYYPMTNMVQVGTLQFSVGSETEVKAAEKQAFCFITRSVRTATIAGQKDTTRPSSKMFGPSCTPGPVTRRNCFPEQFPMASAAVEIGEGRRRSVSYRFPEAILAVGSDRVSGGG